jgi:hypothetical protein
MRFRNYSRSATVHEGISRPRWMNVVQERPGHSTMMLTAKHASPTFRPVVLIKRRVCAGNENRIVR